jgi:hypothetical protein
VVILTPLPLLADPDYQVNGAEPPSVTLAGQYHAGSKDTQALAPGQPVAQG